MADAASFPLGGGVSRPAAARATPAWLRWSLILVCVSFLGLFLLMPLVAVFVDAMSKGLQVYLRALTDPDALSAIRLTLLTAGIAVPLNLVFGLTASWAITRFDFVGKQLLI